MKKHHRILAAIAAAAMLAMPGNATVSAASETTAYYTGDITNDGSLDVRDIIGLQQYLLGMTFSKSFRPYRCDLNHDDSIDVFDLALLKRTVLGNRTAELVTEVSYESKVADVTGAQYADITFSGAAGATVYFDVRYAVDNVEQTENFYCILDENGSFIGRYTVPASVTQITVSVTASHPENNEELLVPCDITAITPVFPEPEQPTEAPSGELVTPTVQQFGKWTPSVGDCKMLTVFVDFADVKYSEPLPVQQMQNELYGQGSTDAPYESLSAWYNRASYGNLHLDGNCYYYTCPGKMSDYMNSDREFETFAMEVLNGLDDQINYADYDANGDGVIDCLAMTVPLDNADAATKEYWWGCTATWWNHSSYRPDGMEITKYIIIDEQPYESHLQGLKSQMLHEMGHSIGLPDYYLYDAGDDWEGYHGDAGHERMDDSIGDFNSFSKLMYGWIRENELQWYNGSGEQTFTLPDATQQGGCLILPISSTVGDITSEYFLIEYVTQSGNNADMKWWTMDSGVRIFHIQADLHTDDWGTTYFKYEGFGVNYMGNDKIRVTRLVNDNGGFYHTGDTCTFGTSNFAGYDASGNQTVNTGYTVTIGALTEQGYTVTVSK